MRTNECEFYNSKNFYFSHHVNQWGLCDGTSRFSSLYLGHCVLAGCMFLMDKTCNVPSHLLKYVWRNVFGILSENLWGDVFILASCAQGNGGGGGWHLRSFKVFLIPSTIKWWHTEAITNHNLVCLQWTMCEQYGGWRWKEFNLI